ncbi:MAG: hypothetical protein AB9Q22_10090 [Candidatus Reddybacter sp.]
MTDEVYVDQHDLTVDQILAQRGERYGLFAEHARITQNIKGAMADSRNWAELSVDKKECLEMLAHKMGRILNGDPEYQDSWDDIAGYSTLVSKNLQGVPQ